MFLVNKNWMNLTSITITSQNMLLKLYKIVYRNFCGSFINITLTSIARFKHTVFCDEVAHSYQLNQVMLVYSKAYRPYNLELLLTS